MSLNLIDVAFPQVSFRVQQDHQPQDVRPCGAGYHLPQLHYDRDGAASHRPRQCRESGQRLRKTVSVKSDIDWKKEKHLKSHPYSCDGGGVYPDPESLLYPRRKLI